MEDKDDKEENEILTMHEKMNEASNGMLVDRKGKPKSSSKYQGVHQMEGNKSSPGKHVSSWENQRLGTYATEVEAARARSIGRLLVFLLFLLFLLFTPPPPLLLLLLTSSSSSSPSSSSSSLCS